MFSKKFFPVKIKIYFQGWLDGQMILDIMLLNPLGADHATGLDKLENDQVLCSPDR